MSLNIKKPKVYVQQYKNECYHWSFAASVLISSSFGCRLPANHSHSLATKNIRVAATCSKGEIYLCCNEKAFKNSDDFYTV